MDPKVSKIQPFENVKVWPSRRCPTQSPDAIHFFVKIAVSQSKLARLTPNLGILWISVCSFWLCGSIVANPIIYRLVPSPSRFEIRQWCKYWTTCQNEHCYSEASSNTTSVKFENAALFLSFSVAGVSKNLREGIETGGECQKNKEQREGVRRAKDFPLLSKFLLTPGVLPGRPPPLARFFARLFDLRLEKERKRRAVTQACAGYVRLGLPSTLVHHENEAFRKRSSNRRNWKHWLSDGFRVDGKCFDNGVSQNDGVSIKITWFPCTSCPQKQIQTDRRLLCFLIPPALCGRKTFHAFFEWNLRFQIPPA